MKVIGFFQITLIVVSILINDVSAQSAIGVYTDGAHSSIAVNNPEGSSVFDLWVWIRPGEYGVAGAEYKLDIPENIIPQSVVINPDNFIIRGEAYGSPGFSIAFADCQTDWFWTAKVQCLLTDRLVSYIRIREHELTGEAISAICLPDYPLEQLTIICQVVVNTALPPILIGVEVTGPSSLRAIFDREVIEDCLYRIEVTPDNAAVFEKENPSNTIEVIAVEIVEGEEHVLDISVGSVLSPQKEYVLTTTHLCAYGWYGCMCLFPVCGDSEMGFTGQTGVKLSSWSAIKSILSN